MVNKVALRRFKLLLLREHYQFTSTGTCINICVFKQTTIYCFETELRYVCILSNFFIQFTVVRAGGAVCKEHVINSLSVKFHLRLQQYFSLSEDRHYFIIIAKVWHFQFTAFHVNSYMQRMVAS